MHLIKKYANRKLYDTTEKRYLTMDRLAQLIKEGAEVTVVDNSTGKDLTASIVTQLLAREKNETGAAVPPSILMQMLRKGRGTLFGYGKKYVSLWQSAFMMSMDEIERFINSLVNDKELSEAEGKNLKKEVVAVTNQLKMWILQNIDRRVTDALKMMNLATHEQIVELTNKVEALKQQLKELEKR